MTTSSIGPWQRFVRVTKRPIWHAVNRLTGKRMALPVHYLDMGMIGGVFRLPAEQAAELVSNDWFVPSIAQDGFARCGVTALEYRKIDILYPYNELAVTIPGMVRGAAHEAELHYYLHLPVTTEDARWPGVEIYGFPKYIATIGFQETGTEISGSLVLAGQEVLALHVTKGETRDDEWGAENLTLLDGEPTLSTFRAYGRRSASDAPGGARLELGEHQIALELRAAGLELTSVSHFTCRSARATLSAPVRLKGGGS